jgi:RNA polymerase sigma factor (sigma-70 family)
MVLMTLNPFAPLIQRVGRLFGTGSSRDATDAELLERFVSGADESAFAVIVTRHGPMVHGVCQRVLHNDHDAEDAFQAVWIVLARSARRLTRRALLANWLYGVARRTALKARTARARRVRHERQATAEMSTEADCLLEWQELRPILDEELGQLPLKQQAAIILCYLEGRTLVEASQLIGCPPGTVATRLARARELLRARLERRGLVLPAAALATLLAERAAPAAVPAALHVAGIAAASVAAGHGSTAAITAPVNELAEGVLRSMFIARLGKLSVLLLLVLGFVGTGLIAHHALAEPVPQVKEQTDPKPAPGTGKDAAAAPERKPDAPVPQEWKVRKVIDPEDDRVVFDSALGLSPDGKIAATARNFKEIVLWDTATSKELAALPIEEGCEVRAIRFTADSRTVVAAGTRGVFFLDVPKVAETTHIPFPPRSVVIRKREVLLVCLTTLLSADLKQAAALWSDGSVLVWDLGGKKEPLVLRVQQHEEPFTHQAAMAFSPDGKILATGGKTGELRFWDMQTGKEGKKVDMGPKPINSIWYTPDGKTLILATYDGLRLCDADTGKERHRFAGIVGTIPNALSADGNLLAASVNGEVVLYDLKAGKKIAVLKSDPGSARQIAFDQSGKTLAVLGLRGIIKLWSGTAPEKN